jgi:Fur family ferric uptake transcriptional regulator
MSHLPLLMHVSRTAESLRPGPGNVNALNPFPLRGWRARHYRKPVPAPLGQRHTRQRDAILQAISEARGPISIQQILERAQAALGSLGIATVYRTLNLLLESGRIQTVILPDGQTCYERSGMGHHDHFQCRRCKNVYDLEVCPLHLAKGTIIPGGFLVEDHEMTLYGLCPDCAAAKSAAKKPRATRSRG